MKIITLWENSAQLFQKQIKNAKAGNICKTIP